DVDGPVGQPVAEGCDVVRGAQRRIDLVACVEATHQVVRQQQVVRGDLGRHGDAALFGPAHDVDAAGGGQVAHVQSGPDVLGQQHVAGDDRLLGDGRPAGQAQLGGDHALVHL